MSSKIFLCYFFPVHYLFYPRFESKFWMQNVRWRNLLTYYYFTNYRLRSSFFMSVKYFIKWNLWNLLVPYLAHEWMRRFFFCLWKSIAIIRIRSKIQCFCQKFSSCVFFCDTILSLFLSCLCISYIFYYNLSWKWIWDYFIWSNYVFDSWVNKIFVWFWCFVFIKVSFFVL